MAEATESPSLIRMNADLKRIEDKLDKLVTQTAKLEGQLVAMPSALAFGEIKGALGKLEGRVEALPTTAQLGTLLAIAVAAITILSKWPEVRAALHI